MLQQSAWCFISKEKTRLSIVAFELTWPFMNGFEKFKFLQRAMGLRIENYFMANYNTCPI